MLFIHGIRLTHTQNLRVGVSQRARKIEFSTQIADRLALETDCNKLLLFNLLK